MSDSIAKEPAEKMRDTMETAMSKAGSMARTHAEAATDAVTQEAENRALSAARAAQAAAGELPAGSKPQEAAQQVAAGLHDVADLLRSTDFDRAAGAVTRFARENPLVFLGGAALLGFAATRFLKASSPDGDAATVTQVQDSPDPWTGHVTATPAEGFAGSRAALENGQGAS